MIGERRVFIGLGTNLGDRRGNLEEALRRCRGFMEIVGASAVYRSEPVGFADQPDFWNLVVEGLTRQEPRALLAALKDVETAMGRRDPFRNAPRCIDLDILLYGRETLDEEGLRIPHERMLERSFVLRPILDLDPGLRDPRTGEPLAAHLARIGEAGLERLFPGAELFGARA